jgi:hypothetical protein
MEGLIVLGVFVVLLIALGILAMRFGFDSREGMPSEEQTLSSRGVRWGEGDTLSPAPVVRHWWAFWRRVKSPT